MGDHRIFVSYSRKDSEIVTPLVQMLRLTGGGVFRDIDNIPPGGKWRAVLVEAIDSCEIVVLFWCCHSSASTEVENEYTQALTAEKRIVPVLLDDSPLQGKLANFQAIDMRGLFGRHVVVYRLGSTPTSSGNVGPRPSDETLEIAAEQLARVLAERFGV